MSEFLEKLKNKVTYYIHKQVNDDDANAYAEEQKQKVTESNPGSKKDYTEALEETPNTTGGISISRIFSQIWSHTVYFIKNQFYIILAVFLASFVANDMMMYPSGMRFVAFLFILSVCISSVSIGYLLGLFYFGKNLYEKYINSELEDSNDPAYQRYFPKIFAFLPLTTKQYESGLANFLLYPFRYCKDDGEEHTEGQPMETEILNKIMKGYTACLNESYPTIERLKKQSFFPEREKEYKKFMDELHKINPKPKPAIEEPPLETPEPSAPNEKIVPLPPTIDEQTKRNATKAAEKIAANENAAKKVANEKIAKEREAYIAEKIVEKQQARVNATKIPSTIQENAQDREELGKEFNSLPK